MTGAGIGPHLTVVGSANADLVMDVTRVPGRGETVLGSGLAVYPGGKGANQAVAAARLGARAALVARIGGDPYGELLRRSLESAGVDLSALRRDADPTGLAVVLVQPGGDNSIIVAPGANARLGEDDVLAARSLIAASRVVSVVREVPDDAVLAAIRTARSAGVRCLLNQSPPGPLAGDLRQAVDPLVVNEHEAAALLDGPSAPGGPVSEEPEEWARALLEAGYRSVALTLGPLGAVVADAHAVTRAPAPRVEAVDTTGAGDAFTAALAWRLAEGEPLARAARFAVRVGSYAVGRAGAQDSYPTAAQIAGTDRDS
ncbi:ribokinase [Planobispora siamensis]|uniref:Ribokinase n=1 Tax=Planobispora siamensis TaxID=936338 RepID=A0A8J3WLC0_9ACTN|nr:ribokinase [Planobispora siamensis]GIH95119.1 ribokinase [Planobispora siamensis]